MLINPKTSARCPPPLRRALKHEPSAQQPLRCPTTGASPAGLRIFSVIIMEDAQKANIPGRVLWGCGDQEVALELPSCLGPFGKPPG